MRIVHTLHSNNKTIGIRMTCAPQYEMRWYIVGIESPYLARSVHYNIAHNPSIRLVRVHENRNILFIEKGKYMQGGVVDPVQDVGFHMMPNKWDEFMALPFQKGLGVILIPQGNACEMHEDSKAFTFRGVEVIDPKPFH